MKLSDGEQLILIMLCDLYKHLGIEGEIDPKFVESAIISGNTWGLRWQYHGIPFSRDETDPPIVSEVANILDMWSFIESSYEKLSEDDKAKVESEAEPFGKHVKFPGFDGNNESEHYGTARFLIEDLKRFSTFRNRDLNSHCPSLDKYRRMYAIFEPLRPSLTNGRLGVSEIIELLKARQYQAEPA